ncbi:MAG: LysR family transcriptional regulator [Anaerolineaceae bacterium]|nr:LysR family transcriptional regulator [Anaerolineaceae bacterium]
MLDAKLETLLVVAEEKSFTKAATILSLTQPAVSNHISMLEKETGVKIFFRNKGEVRITPEGEIVVKYAKRIKSLYKKMFDKISELDRQMVKIRVGITHTSESNEITEVLAKYGVSHGNINISIITDTIKNLYDMLENYEIDFAIIEGGRQMADLNYLMLDMDYLVCILSNNNPLSKKSMVSLDDLKKEHIILRLPESETRKLFEATLISVNDSIDNFDVSIEVDNVATIKDLIRKDLGVSVLPQSACMDELRKGKITALPIENLSMARETNIVYNKDFARLDLIRDFVDLYNRNKMNGYSNPGPM